MKDPKCAYCSQAEYEEMIQKIVKKIQASR